MELYFNTNLASGYSSPSQIIRILSESWMKENMYCPRCGNGRLGRFQNNRAVADFYCPACANEFELKSHKGLFKGKIMDGAYNTFIERITSNNNPDFFFLNYMPQSYTIKNLWFVPKHFFTPDIVEKRPPLSQNARRAGWVGCNIMFDEIPSQGRIAIIQDHTLLEKESVLRNVSRAENFVTTNIEARGWLFHILNYVNRMPQDTFSLTDMYRFEDQLQALYPNNHNIRAKIRQQLQNLRDKGVVTFLGNGIYQKQG